MTISLRLRAVSLLLAFGLSGCGSSDSFVITNPPSNPAPTRKLLAVYMVGSDLQSAFEAGRDDLLEMVDGLATMTEQERSELDLVIAFGGANQDGWRGMKWMDAPQLLADAADGQFGNQTAPGAYLRSDDGANMADPANLAEFLSYLARTYPFETERFVVLWNHGGSYQGYGYDENFRRILKLPEIDGAFEQANLPRLDLLGFDACLMASVEVAQAVEGRGRLLVASEETEPGHGWNYRYVVPNYIRLDDPRAFATGLVDDYVRDDSHDELSDGKTLSVLDLDRLDDFLAALNAYAQPYSLQIGPNAGVTAGFVRALVASQAFGVSPDGSRVSIDLLDFVERSQANLAVDNQATAAFLQAFSTFVVHSNDDGSVERAGGVAIIPSDLTGRALAPAAFPSQGWLALTQASIELIVSDRNPPVLSDLALTAQGLDATFVDPLLVKVAALYGFRTADGSLVSIEEIRATPLPEANRWRAPLWDGQALHLTFDAQQPPALLPTVFDRSELLDDGRRVEIHLADVEILPARDPDRIFKKATMALLFQNGVVVDYEIQPVQVDAQGNPITDRTISELEPGDQLRIFAPTYREGGQFDLGRTQVGSGFTVSTAPTFSSRSVQPDAGTTLSFAIFATDFSGNTTVSASQPFAAP